MTSPLPELSETVTVEGFAGNETATPDELALEEVEDALEQPIMLQARTCATYEREVDATVIVSDDIIWASDQSDQESELLLRAVRY